MSRKKFLVMGTVGLTSALAQRLSDEGYNTVILQAKPAPKITVYLKPMPDVVYEKLLNKKELAEQAKKKFYHHFYKKKH